MADEWTITLDRDTAIVLADYLHRWFETDDLAFTDKAERAALNLLLARLEKADDGTAFRADYLQQVAAARDRLRPRI